MRSKRLPLLVCVFAGIVCAAGCPGQREAPVMRVVHEALDLGLVAVGDSTGQVLRIRNEGGSPLVVEALWPASGEHEGSFQISPAVLEIPPGAGASVTVTFSPTEPGEVEGQLHLNSNDPTAGDVRVSLIGEGVLPEIQASPDALDFGPVEVGTQSEREIVLENQGVVAARIRVFKPEGEGAASFRLRGPEGQIGDGDVLTVPAGGSEVMQVVYAPSETDTHEATFMISPCEICTDTSVSLEGVGIDTELVGPAHAVDIGMVRPGRSMSREVSFRNAGAVALEITDLELVDPIDGGPASSAFRVEHDPLPLEVEPGQTVVIDVTFTPEDLGGQWARLNWTSTDRVRQKGTVLVSGWGGAPAIEVTPAVVFEETVIGFPMHGVVEIGNDGEEDLELVDLTITGNGSFRVVEPTPEVVPAGEVRELSLAFDPTAAGSLSGFLHILSNDPHDPEVITWLLGEAFAPAPCNLTLTPEALAFGLVERHGTRERQVRLTNVGEPRSRCQIASLTVRDDAVGAFRLEGVPHVGTIIDSGESIEVTVAFQPRAFSAFEAVLEVRVSDPEVPIRSMPLTGRSAQTNVLVAPSHLDFGLLPVDCGSGLQEVCIHNGGSTIQTVSDIELRGPAGAFHLENLPTGLGESGAWLPAGGSLCFGVAFHSPSPADHAAEVAVVLDEIDEPFLVTLSAAAAVDPVHTETFEQSGRMVDVLFVVPEYNSGAAIQEALRDGAETLFSFAGQPGVDFHIGVLSTDARDSHGGGLLRPLDGSRPSILTRSTPDGIGAFRENVMVGTSPMSADSRPFWAVEKALDPDAALGDPPRNDGFLRGEAELAIIFMSTHPEYSEGTVDHYWSAFAKAKGYRPADLAVHVLVGQTCGVNPPHTRFLQMAARTGGLDYDICTFEWESDLAELASHIFGDTSRFVLSNAADPDTVAVEIVREEGGERVTAEHWTFAPDENAVVFDALARPPIGDSVEITYRTACVP